MWNQYKFILVEAKCHPCAHLPYDSGRRGRAIAQPRDRPGNHNGQRRGQQKLAPKYLFQRYAFGVFY